MGKPSAASSGPLEPADWPDWVLSFPGGYQTTDPRRQAARRLRVPDVASVARGLVRQAWPRCKREGVQ